MPVRIGNVVHGSSGELSLSYYGIELIHHEHLFDFFGIEEAYLIETSRTSRVTIVSKRNFSP